MVLICTGNSLHIVLRQFNSREMVDTSWKGQEFSIGGTNHITKLTRQEHYTTTEPIGKTVVRI